jgi:hypothetical protein
LAEIDFCVRPYSTPSVAYDVRIPEQSHLRTNVIRGIAQLIAQPSLHSFEFGPFGALSADFPLIRDELVPVLSVLCLAFAHAVWRPSAF